MLGNEGQVSVSMSVSVLSRGDKRIHMVGFDCEHLFGHGREERIKGWSIALHYSCEGSFGWDKRCDDDTYSET